jgi:hypothetical protein
LWAKTQVYVERANDSDRDDPLFALWSHLAFELLVRSTIAFVSPTLLADTRRNHRGLLYALEIDDAVESPSASISQLLEICKDVIGDFSDEDVTASRLLIDYRNRELHTGDPVYLDLPPASWLARYYALCDKLLRRQGKSLDDLFGSEDAAAAEQMIDALTQEIKKRVKDMIASRQREWNALTDEERELRTAASQPQFARGLSRPARCPACNCGVRVTGELVVTGRPRLDVDHEITESITVLPTALQCEACGLELSGHAELHVADLGGQFSVDRSVDPVEFHGIEIDDYIDSSRYVAIPDGPEYEDE